jgi:hypothetical protein
MLCVTQSVVFVWKKFPFCRPSNDHELEILILFIGRKTLAQASHSRLRRMAVPPSIWGESSTLVFKHFDKKGSRTSIALPYILYNFILQHYI